MKMDAKRESAADLRNLILYNPETGKTRKIRPGFSWLFLLIGPFGFFFRGMVKEGLLWVLGLAVACRLFDSEVGYYPLFDFKHVGYGIGIALSFIGNYYCLERLLEQAGFLTEAVYADMETTAPGEECQRWVFVTRNHR